MRRYALGSQYNMRDLGGYPTADGKYTSYKKIFRSDCPLNVKEEDQNEIRALQIGTVIDLRTPSEAKIHPSYFASQHEVSYHNVVFQNGNELPENEEDIALQYFDMLQEKQTMNKIMQIIAEAEGNVLYHCAVGKDRTGMVSAAILGICNVNHSDIIADYQLSGTYIYELSKAYKEEYTGLPSWFGQSKPEYMRGCLNELVNKYDSFTGYAEAMEIPEKIIKAIRNKLIY